MTWLEHFKGTKSEYAPIKKVRDTYNEAAQGTTREAADFIELYAITCGHTTNDPKVHSEHAYSPHGLDIAQATNLLPHSQDPPTTTQPKKLLNKPMQQDITLGISQLEDWTIAARIWDGEEPTHISKGHFSMILGTIRKILTPEQLANTLYNKDGRIHHNYPRGPTCTHIPPQRLNLTSQTRTRPQTPPD